MTSDPIPHTLHKSGKCECHLRAASPPPAYDTVIKTSGARTLGNTPVRNPTTVYTVLDMPDGPWPITKAAVQTPAAPASPIKTPVPIKRAIAQSRPPTPTASSKTPPPIIARSVASTPCRTRTGQTVFASPRAQTPPLLFFQTGSLPAAEQQRPVAHVPEQRENIHDSINALGAALSQLQLALGNSLQAAHNNAEDDNSFPVDPRLPYGPEHERPPKKDYRGKWYAVTRGTRVGVFHDWNSVSDYTQGVPNSSQCSFKTHALAVDSYLSHRENGEVELIRLF